MLCSMSRTLCYITYSFLGGRSPKKGTSDISATQVTIVDVQKKHRQMNLHLE